MRALRVPCCVSAVPAPALHRSAQQSQLSRQLSRPLSQLSRPLSQLSSAGDSPREAMEYDVVIVGGGPAGLSAAVRLKQRNENLSVCVLEKGAEIGAHTISGNVFDPRALDELLPEWKELGAPLETEVTHENFYLLSENHSMPLPVPPMLDNKGNYIISLGRMTKWLADIAVSLGVEIYPGFAASEVLYDSEGRVQGVATGDVGIGADGNPKASFARGMELRAPATLFAEGARGSLTEMVSEKYNLRAECDPQTYSLGVKEVWQIPEDSAAFRPGQITHTLGWPLTTDVYGGSFAYHMEPNLLHLGFVVGLDYANPYLSPYGELQRFKTHPIMSELLKGASPVSYGARVIACGGLQAIPRLTFPGGALIGCSAGFMNVPRIKGSHTAIKSGMLAADAFADGDMDSYEALLKQSWVWSELNAVRNVKPAFKKLGGLFGGLAYSGATSLLLKGREPWTFRCKVKDVDTTLPAHQCKPIEYPRPDGVLTFDLLENLSRSGVNHVHDQPVHLKFRESVDIAKAVPESFAKFAGPETRFCPAKVYEFVEEESGPRLQINAQNCVHCKTCDIKTPSNYIKWVVPEGAGGPS